MEERTLVRIGEHKHICTHRTNSHGEQRSWTWTTQFCRVAWRRRAVEACDVDVWCCRSRRRRRLLWPVSVWRSAAAAASMCSLDVNAHAVSRAERTHRHTQIHSHSRHAAYKCCVTEIYSPTQTSTKQHNTVAPNHRPKSESI